MRSADRRKAFFAVCMMAVLLFSHLGVCLWQTQIAQVQNLTAEVGVLTVTAACICLAGYRMVRFVHNSDGKKDLPFWLSQVSEAS